MTATELISELYPEALDCEISITDFWNLSVMEISDLMQSFKRKRDRQLKQELINGFAFAQNTAELIGRYLNEENTVRMPWDFFPDQFAEEKKQYEELEEKKQIERAKENGKAYAAELKRRHEAGLV